MSGIRVNNQIVSTETRSLWMGEIEPWMEETSISSLFNHIAPVMGVKIIKDKMTGLPAGYGFVEFDSHETAKKVLEKLNGQQIPGMTKNYRLNWAVQSGNTSKIPQPIMPSGGYSGAPTSGEHSVYVGELDPNVTDSILLNAFSSYKTVINAHVIVDQITKRSKKYGFVRFSDFEESQRAIYEMNGKYILSRPIKLNIGFKKSNPPAVTSASSYMPSYQHYSQPGHSYSYPQSSYPQSSYPASSYPQSSYPQSSYPQSSYMGYQQPAPGPSSSDSYKHNAPSGYNYMYNYDTNPYTQSHNSNSGYNYNASSAYQYPPPSQSTYATPPQQQQQYPSSYPYPQSSYPAYQKPGQEPIGTQNVSSSVIQEPVAHNPNPEAAKSVNELSQAINVNTSQQYTTAEVSKEQEIDENEFYVELENVSVPHVFSQIETKIENEKYLKDIWNRFGKIDIM